MSGTDLFPDFVFVHPDFIEFDELNELIVTRHTRENTLRIWDMNSYKLLYIVEDVFIHEIKIANNRIIFLTHIISQQPSPNPITSDKGTLYIAIFDLLSGTVTSNL